MKAHSTLTTRARRLAWALALPLAVVACVRQDNAAGEVVVASAPPPLQQEVIDVQPGPDYVWVGGYWTWRHDHHEWVRGQWKRPPHGRHQWVAPRWEHNTRGYVFIDGHWN